MHLISTANLKIGIYAHGFPANPCHTNSMKTNNPYVNTLLEMGYDIKDTQTSGDLSSPTATKKTFPCVIHGRQFDTEEQYNDELNEFMMGL